MKHSIFESIQNIHLTEAIIVDFIIMILTVILKKCIIKIRFLEFRKCSIIDYTILKRKEIRCNIKYIYIKLFSNFIMVILYGVIYLFVAEISTVFLKIKYGFISHDNGIFILALVIVLVFLVAYCLSKLENYNKIKWCGLAGIESLLILIFILYFLESGKTCIIIIFYYSIILCIASNIILDKYILRKLHIKNKKIYFFILVIRYISFVTLIYSIIFSRKSYNAFYWIWSVIICIENAFFLIDDLNYYNFYIYTKDKIIEVNNSIVQCYNSQVIYKTKDGLVNFIEGENIKFISFEIKKKIKKKTNNNVVCVFTNGKKDYYSDYKINKKDWIKLKKDLGIIYKIYVYNNKYIKSIGTKND